MITAQALSIGYGSMKVMTVPIFHVDDLSFGPLLPADIPTIARTAQDPAARKWTRVPRTYTEETAAQFIADCEKKAHEGTAYTFAVRKDGALLAWIDLRITGSLANIGFLAVPEARSKGLTTRAVRAVIAYAFKHFQLEKIAWMCWVVDGEINWASAKVAYACGMHFDGIVHGSEFIHGKLIDTLHAWIGKNDPLRPSGLWLGPEGSRPAMPSSRDPEALVRQFHEVYRLPIVSDVPRVDRPRTHMRMALISEEFGELVGSVYGSQARDIVEEAVQRAVAADDGTRDVIETADALGDLVYVIYGMALEMGIDLPAVLEQVQASNLSKLGADGEPIYREDGKVLKGPNFFPPNIARALGLE